LDLEILWHRHPGEVSLRTLGGPGSALMSSSNLFIEIRHITKQFDTFRYFTGWHYNQTDQGNESWLLIFLIDLSPFEWNFDLDKSGQKFHHSLNEHHKVSIIFRSFVAKCCKMRFNWSSDYQFPFVIQNDWKTANFARLYYPHFTTFRNETLEYY
jgi:hypothetical protein